MRLLVGGAVFSITANVPQLNEVAYVPHSRKLILTTYLDCGITPNRCYGYVKLRIMELKEVKTITDIKQGDTLIVTGDTLKNEPVKAQIVKITPNDGTEIIIDKKMNRFFNLGMYLEGKSWVKDVRVVI
jgi:hypothetical protein